MAEAARRAAAVGTAACALLAACDSGGERAVAAKPFTESSIHAGASKATQLEVGGCRQQWRDGRCEIGEGGELVLWREARFEAPEWALDGRALAAGEEAPVAGGYQVTLTLPRAGDLLTLKEGGRQTGTLPLASALEPLPVQQALQAAEDAKNRGDPAGARHWLEPLIATAGPGQTRARGLLARILLREGNAEQAAQILEETTRELSRSGAWSEAAKDVAARAYLLAARLGKPQQAESWLERHAPLLEGTSLGAALLLESRGMLAYTQERLGEALHWYDRAGTRFLRLGRQEGARLARSVGIGILGDIGRVEEALSLHRKTPAPAGHDACASARFYMLRAWLAMRASAGAAPEPSARLQADLERAARWEKRCGDPTLVSKGRTNRALWALSLGDLDEAVEAAQALAADLPRSADAYQWALEALGQVALAQGDLAAARKHFERQGLLGRAAAQLEAPLRADLGLAETALAEGDEAQAATHLAAAFERLKKAQRLAPLGPLGQTFSDSRQGAARRLMALAWRRGALSEAYEVAFSMFQTSSAARASLGARPRPELSLALDRYRAARRALDTESAADWQLSSQELALARQRRTQKLRELRRLLSSALQQASTPLAASEPARLSPGEAELLAVPHGRRWLLFGRSSGALHGVEVAGFAALTEDAGDPQVSALKAALWQATQVKVLAAGEAQQWHWEKLQWGGEPLSRKRLAFSSGLGPSPRKHPSGPPLVVGDPRGDLPNAAREAALVGEALGKAVARVVIGPRATPSLFSELAENASFLHYAGHAETNNAGTQLLLGGGSALAGWELFSLQRVPAEVVLSACTAGSGAVSKHGPGWGLAQLFLALGSDAIVAPLGPVGDKESLEFQRALYERVARKLPLSEAFWQATAKPAEAGGLGSPRSGGLQRGSLAASPTARAATAPFRLFVR